MITISRQGFISEQGKRSNNEDNYGLIKGATYVVCDGVGGSDKGEIASEMTVRSFIESYNADPNADANLVLQKTEELMMSYYKTHPDAGGMATTLTFSQVRANGVYVAWVGDSRIYQFRNGAIIFKTTDHSWVNDALKAGILSAQEAIDHPKSNVITRAVQGSHKPTEADTALLTDIQRGDLFFHCTDGVLESWEDDSLKALFASENDPDKILERIKAECLLHSRDNFTAIVYKIDAANIPQAASTSSGQSTVPAIPVSKEDFHQAKPDVMGVLKVKLLGIPLFVILAGVMFLGVAYISFNGGKTGYGNPKVDSTSTSPRQTTATSPIEPNQVIVESPVERINNLIVESKWPKSKPKENATLSDLREKLKKSTDPAERQKFDSSIREWQFESISVRGVQYFGKEWRKKNGDKLIKDIEGILKESGWSIKKPESSELKTLESKLKLLEIDLGKSSAKNEKQDSLKNQKEITEKEIEKWQLDSIGVNENWWYEKAWKQK